MWYLSYRKVKLSPIPEKPPVESWRIGIPLGVDNFGQKKKAEICARKELTNLQREDERLKAKYHYSDFSLSFVPIRGVTEKEFVAKLR